MTEKVSVFSASELCEKDKARIEKIFSKKHSGAVEFSYSVDAALLGGLLIIDGIITIPRLREGWQSSNAVYCRREYEQRRNYPNRRTPARKDKFRVARPFRNACGQS